MRQIFITILTPFVPEDNTYVRTMKEYIRECARGLFYMIFLSCLLIAGAGYIADASIMPESILLLYIIGTVLAVIWHAKHWKDIHREKGNIIRFRPIVKKTSEQESTPKKEAKTL